MTLTSEEITMIVIDHLTGKKPRIDNDEAKTFLKRFKKDEEVAEKNGWTIELPYEVGAEKE